MDDLLTPQLLLHIPFVMEVLTTKDICLKRHEYIVVVTPWIADKEKDSFVWRWPPFMKENFQQHLCGMCS